MTKKARRFNARNKRLCTRYPLRVSCFVINSSFVIRHSSFSMTPPARASTKRDLLADEFLRFLAVERNASPRTLKAYASALAKIREQLKAKPWLKCQTDDFREYLFHLSKKTRARSQCRSAVAKAAKAIADRAHAATNGGASFRPAGCEKTIRRSSLDAATRCRGSGTILQ